MQIKTGIQIAALAGVAVARSHIPLVELPETPVVGTDPVAPVVEEGPGIEIIDFQDLKPPTAHGLPIDDYCGLSFTGLNVQKVKNGRGILEGSFGPGEYEDCNIAWIDPTAPEGCTIDVPEGMELRSVSFMCCSLEPGKSFLEGKGCTPVPCDLNVNARGVSKKNQKLAKGTTVYYDPVVAPVPAQEAYPGAPVYPGTTVTTSGGGIFDGILDPDFQLVNGVPDGGEGGSGGSFHDGILGGGSSGGGGLLSGLKKTDEKRAIPGIETTQNAVKYGYVVTSMVLASFGATNALPPIGTGNVGNVIGL